MMDKIRKVVLGANLFVAITFFACSPVPTFYLVVEDEVELKNLSGQWDGEFDISISGRNGTISITIIAEHDTAFGEVALHWNNSVSGYVPNGQPVNPADVERYVNSTQLIKIKEISFENGRLGGIIEPYPDPECDCLITTNFQGKLLKDSMAGTFVSNIRETRNSYRGKWKVSRKTQVNSE